MLAGRKRPASQPTSDERPARKMNDRARDDDGRIVALEPARQPKRYFGSDKMQQQQQQQQQTAAVQGGGAGGGGKQQQNNNNNKKKKKRKHSFDSIFSFGK